MISDHINSEFVFRRVLLLSSCMNDVTSENVISQPISLIPGSLFHDHETYEVILQVRSSEKDVFFSSPYPVLIDLSEHI